MFKLRELNGNDLNTINKWRNNRDLIKNLGAPFRFIGLEVDKRWYENCMNNRSTTVRCAIVDESDQILGLVSLTSIDQLNQSAEFHIMIGDADNQGKGIGSFVVKEMLKHAFLNLNLQRVELTVLENNERAKHLYEKCGFQFEGIKRKSKYKNGEFVNMWMYSILKEEFSRGRIIEPFDIVRCCIIPLLVEKVA